MQSSNTKYFLIQFTKYWSFRLKYEYISSVVFKYSSYWAQSFTSLMENFHQDIKIKFLLKKVSVEDLWWIEDSH